MYRILIIDDDSILVENVTKYLRDFNYTIASSPDGMDGLSKIKSFQPDVVILDLMMPNLDGLEVCRKIKKACSIPIIMLTARGGESDIVTGLEVGADDYLTKPFSLRELAARVKARLRGAENVNNDTGHGGNVIVNGNLTIDASKRELYKKNKRINLTGTEFNLLWFMASRPGIVFSRDRLLEELRNRELEPFDRSIDAHISHLRKKIEQSPKNPKYIVTVWGVGYKFQGN